MTLQRAYGLLELKSLDEDKREIVGIASTITPDRMGDVVEPKGAEFKLPVPLLWQHNSHQPIGEVYAAKATKDGIEIKARVFKATEARTLIERLDEAWESIKIKLVKGLSIGFRPIEYAFNDDGGLHFMKWEWLELSAVTIPANAEASITTIKSLDAETRAALGKKAKAQEKTAPPVVGKPSGVTEKKTEPVKLQHRKGNKMDINEQIKNFQNERAAKAAAMEKIMKEASDQGLTLNEEQAETYDGLEQDIAQIDKHLARLKTLQTAKAASATDVTGATTEKKASEARQGVPQSIMIKKDKDEAFKGQNFTRMVIARTVAQKSQLNMGGIRLSASQIAEQRWGKTNPSLVAILKANEVAGGGTGGSDWGNELVALDGKYTGDFIEYLYSKTVYDKLPLREVPANVTIKGQDGAATGYWVGEHKAIPATKADFSTVNLSPLKVAALATISNELIRYSDPSAELLVRDALVEASAQRIDSTFLSANAASSGVSPAGLLNGVSGHSSNGTDAQSVREDIKTLLSGFVTAKNASGLYFVMNPNLALNLSLMRNSLDQKIFPDIRIDGGTLEGYPVVTGDNIAADDFILIKPSDIYKIGDQGVEVSLSTEATIEQNSVPTGAGDTPAAQAEDMVNMFQSDMTAFKVVRPINFAKRRSTAVDFITDAAYSSANES